MGRASRMRSKQPHPLLSTRGVGIALGVILLGVLAVVAFLDSSRPGELVFTQESVDVGQVPIGQAVVYRFSMRNAGAQPVKITKKSAAALEGC